MGVMSFFGYRKNISLLVAVASIALGAVLLVLSTPMAFGPWITPSPEGPTQTDRFLTLISVFGIFISLSVIILGVVVCTRTYRDKKAALVPLFVLTASTLFIVMISIAIFGIIEISMFFYISILLLVFGILFGFVFIFFFLKNYDSESTLEAIERRKKEEAEAALEKERREREESEKAEKTIAALERILEPVPKPSKTSSTTAAATPPPAAPPPPFASTETFGPYSPFGPY